MISTANITMQFGEKPLFEDISIKFSDGNKYGLIGANGCGKSTFMKILTGTLTPSAGTVSIGNGIRLGVLGQDQFAFEKEKVIDTVIMGHKKLWEIKQERDRIYGLPEMSEKDGIKVAELEMEFAEMDGYSAESSAGELLMGLGIEESLHFGLMSGVAPGWKMRVLLAQAMFSNPDILLLDEPTNNLDINSIKWLEDTLMSKKATMVIISHDRHFLNGVCTHMADLDYGSINVFPGNYDDFMIASTAIQEKMQSDNAKKEAKIKELKHFVSRFSANASKSKQATSRQKQLEKISLDDIRPSSRITPYIIFNQDKAVNKNALVIKGLGQTYDKPLFANVDMIIEAGDRVGITGQNGVGKTTLLKLLNGNEDASSGTIKWSDNAKIGYYAQDHAADFAEDMSLIDWMSQWRQDGQDIQEVRGILGKMLFKKDDINKRVKSLSGGEKGRMLFGKLMLQKNNVLLMDEPTNHLDMESIEGLNLALANYDGTLIFVSHDREFLSSLATKMISIENGQLDYYQGNYNDFETSKK
jgi:ATPase subunit of ABC transporter with duplicated ATPase domains